jgi:SAM-dependent methyltransferase
MTRFYCPHSGRLLCRDVGAITYREGAFWAWHEAWWIDCPDCGGSHPSLDRAEFDGRHPWQLHAADEAAGKWLSSEAFLTRYPPPVSGRVQPGTLSDADVDLNWSRNADIWDATYDDQGDRTRKYYSDPVLFAFLGDVDGNVVLDAGSGAGYVSRMLARRGARVIAVENSRRFHEIASEYQRCEPLAIEVHHASISSMPFIDTASIDAAVANFVLMDVLDYQAAIAEIARVLKPGGRFVFVLTHTSTHARWLTPAIDSPRREDRAGLLEDDYFVRDAGYSQWGELHPVLGLNRPLRDYIAACKASGLELRDLEEPEVSEEGERELPAWEVRDARRLAYNWVIRVDNVRVSMEPPA